LGGSKNFGGPKPPETSKFQQLRDLMANISGTQQDRHTVKRKALLQTAITPAHAHLTILLQIFS